VRTAHKGDIRKRNLIPPLVGKPAERMMAIYEKWFARQPEIAVLRMLGFFDGPASEDEIAALRAKPKIRGLTTFLEGQPRTAWDKAVTTLRDVGLLAPASENADSEKLDAHPLVRGYFAELLRRGHQEAWREGHRRLYEHLQQKAPDLPETIEEMAPLYAAVVHGCHAGQAREAFHDVWGRRIQRGNDYFSMTALGAFGSEVAVLSTFFDPPWEWLVQGLSDTDEALVLSNAGSALRALGRLPEAARLMQMALDRRLAEEAWKNAAIIATNLCELFHARGDLREAEELARKSVELAGKSGDALQRVASRTVLAAALHAMGHREDAAAWFEEAERMQKEWQPGYPRLYSLSGFRYCDLLHDQGLGPDVQERAAQTLEWAKVEQLPLDIALDHLSLGRAHILVVQRGAASALTLATSHLAASVDGLRRAGQQNYLPLGLLARAALHTHTRDFPLARKDLDEALTLATRCGFRLHECDAHLGLARLAVAEGSLAAARPHVERARKLIDDTGYHRRDEELAALDAACGS
jgi:tetratricopeptide (TPR) repeat protein